MKRKEFILLILLRSLTLKLIIWKFYRGQTALHKAANNKRRSICYMLVAAGASLTLHDNDGCTPRMLALNADDHELATYLESK